MQRDEETVIVGNCPALLGFFGPVSEIIANFPYRSRLEIASHVVPAQACIGPLRAQSRDSRGANLFPVANLATLL